MFIDDVLREYLYDIKTRNYILFVVMLLKDIIRILS